MSFFTVWKTCIHYFQQPKVKSWSDGDIYWLFFNLMLMPCYSYWHTIDIKGHLAWKYALWKLIFTDWIYFVASTWLFTRFYEWKQNSENYTQPYRPIWKSTSFFFFVLFSSQSSLIVKVISCLINIFILIGIISVLKSLIFFLNSVSKRKPRIFFPERCQGIISLCVRL